MEIREYLEYNEEEILRLYGAVGWGAYLREPEILRRGFEKSLLVLAAVDGGELIGVIRVVGDGETIVYVQDLLVLPEWQRCGVGLALVRAVLERFSGVRQVVLMADDAAGVVAFYEAAGFKAMDEVGCRGFVVMRG